MKKILFGLIVLSSVGFAQTDRPAVYAAPTFTEMFRTPEQKAIPLPPRMGSVNALNSNIHNASWFSNKSSVTVSGYKLSDWFNIVFKDNKFNDTDPEAVLVESKYRPEVVKIGTTWGIIFHKE